MAKNVRILILLSILALVGFYTHGQKRSSTNWLEPLQVVVYPINADGTENVERYIDTLNDARFKAVDDFLAREAEYFGLAIDEPVETRYGGRIKQLPPLPPEGQPSLLSVMLWSLQFRYWAWRNAPDDQSNYRRVRIYVLYHEPIPDRRLAHSVGIDKGLLAVVNAFASKDQEGENNVVIAHELLHTVGATDKYDANGNPVYPDGYARPDLGRYPQREAEIMAGRIPLAPGQSRMPESLLTCVIGEKTASEIRWLR